MSSPRPGWRAQLVDVTGSLVVRYLASKTGGLPLVHRLMYFEAPAEEPAGRVAATRPRPAGDGPRYAAADARPAAGIAIQSHDTNVLASPTATRSPAAVNP